MRIWLDLTNSPHVLVMRPIVQGLRERGDEVEITARDFAQTLPLLRRFQIPHTVIGRHRGERLAAKAAGIASRSGALAAWAMRRRRAVGEPFALAIGHGSNDISVAAKLLKIPSATMFDYEWAAIQHHLNCRLADLVLVPEAIPQARLRRYGAAGKVKTYPGLKEEYYLADFERSEQVLTALALTREIPIVTVRTPPEVSLYHRFHNDLFGAVIEALSAAAAAAHVQPVVLPRTPQQREQLRSVPHLIVPEGAIDAQSLIAFSALVVSAGGTMNREAVALGVPVCSTFAGKLGAVDGRLMQEGRLSLLTDVAQLPLQRLRTHGDLAPPEQSAQADIAQGEPAVAIPRVRRDPALLIDLLCSAARR